MFAVFLFAASCLLTLLGQGNGYTVPALAALFGPQPKFVVFQEKKTWTEAREACNENGMSLAIIPTYEVQQDLRNFIRKNGLLPKDENSGYWLGAQSEMRKWYWEYTGDSLDGDRFRAGWHWGQPDYLVRADGMIQECMEMKYINNTVFDASLSWNDLWCDEKRGFICQHIDDNDIIR